MPFEDPTWMQNNGYAAREDRYLLTALSGGNEGILRGFVGLQRASGANMSIDIGTTGQLSQAFVQGDDQVNQGMYLVTNTSVDNVTISPAPGSNSRITIVYVRVNDPNATGPAGNNAAYGTVDGSSAATPIAPTVPTSALALFSIVVPSGTTAITSSMITRIAKAARFAGTEPFGVAKPYFGTEAGVPSDHLLCYGQEVSRATYFGLFDAINILHGAGNGSTTFNMPDLRGVVPAGLDNMGGVDRGLLTTANTLGAVIGEEKHVLTVGELATHLHVQDPHTHGGSSGGESNTHTHTGTTGVESTTHSHTGTSGGQSVNHTHSGTTGTQTAGHYHGFGAYGPVVQRPGGASAFNLIAGSNDIQTLGGTGTESDSHAHPFTSGTESATHTHTTTTGGQSVNHTHSFTSAANVTDHTHTVTVNSTTATNQNTGSGTAHNNVQPTIMCNWIMRAI